jgi:type II secretory ATPase GspE/PulE/Tfp pilus assembly ATPase PilB-like protein
MLAKANIPAQRVDKFYQTPTEVRQDKDGNPVICPACQGSGYVGRTAAFELLEVTDDIRQLVAAVAPLPQIKAACRKNKMLYLQEQALLKVMSGLTSIQEVIRVTQQEKKS